MHSSETRRAGASVPPHTVHTLAAVLTAWAKLWGAFIHVHLTLQTCTTERRWSGEMCISALHLCTKHTALEISLFSLYLWCQEGTHRRNGWSNQCRFLHSDRDLTGTRQHHIHSSHPDNLLCTDREREVYKVDVQFSLSILYYLYIHHPFNVWGQ